MTWMWAPIRNSPGVRMTRMISLVEKKCKETTIWLKHCLGQNIQLFVNEDGIILVAGKKLSVHSS
jgi:hypothetical protein